MLLPLMHLVACTVAEVESPWVGEQRSFFRAVDADADGELTPQELEDFFARKTDGGGDGTVKGGAWSTDGELTPIAYFDVHNMLRYKLKKGGKLRHGLNKLLDGSNAVSKAHLTALLRRDADSTTLLTEAYMQAHEDRDGNGKLSWTEFLMPHHSAAGPQDEL